MKPQGQPPYASALHRAEAHISEEELEENAHFNTTLVFMPKSPLHPVMRELQRAFIATLQATPLPPGFSPPIAAGRKREKASWRNAETLLANLLVMKADGKPTLSVSLSPNDYSPTKLTAGIINLINLAAHQSRLLLVLKKGFHDPNNPGLSRRARIRPTRKFWAMCDLMDTVIGEDDICSEPHDLINLRRAKAQGQRVGDLIPRKYWEKTVSKETAEILDVIKLSLHWFNLVLAEYDITYTKAKDRKKHTLFPTLYAVYTGDFAHGGRFYTARGGHQNLSRIERATICFNGHPTTELDYCGLHIRMLYHFAGFDYPPDADPYGAVLDAMGKNPKAIFRQFPGIRDDLKEMLLALVNDTARSSDEAVSRADWRMFHRWQGMRGRDGREETKRECESCATRWAKAGLLNCPGKPSTEAVLGAFRKAHAPIETYFSSGCGLELQNIDAQIARWVMIEMMVSTADQCIPCLPVHDSFITFREYEPTLRKAMVDSYRHVMQQQTGRKQRFTIPVKRIAP